MLQMNQHYEPEFKKIVRLHLKEGISLSKVLQQNTEYRMQVSQIGQNNSVKNAKLTKKPKPIMIT